ncbi:hypothetical protein [Spirillospora sp. CA-294931]|uniref:hypothetical protein n=1 Tax=Spirillospora sp. CA-294931 TaxID=3240042 RepID=UPI003D89D18D
MTVQQHKPRPAWAVRIQDERQERGWSKHEMARRLYAAKWHTPPTPDQVVNLASQIRAWEKGQHFPRDWADAYATAYAIPLDALFPGPLQGSIALPPGTVDQSPTPDQGDDDMERRALLQLLAALGAGTAVPADALEAVRTRLDGTVATTVPDANEWESVAWEYGHTLLTVPANVVITRLAVDVVEIRRVLERARTPATRAGLQRASAQTAAVMAMALHDTGDLPAAWRWWRTARHAADASGDRDLAVWTRAREAHNGRYGLRHETIVTQLNDAAIALADGKPSAGLASALSNRAVLASEHGDKTTALATLHQLDKVYGRLPASVTGDGSTVWGWDESRLRQVEGGTYSRLGQTDSARPALTHAAALCPADRAAYRACITMRMGLCDIHDGEVSHGLESAVTAVTGLPPKWRATYVTHTAHDVLAGLPEKARALPAARELRTLTAGT